MHARTLPSRRRWSTARSAAKLRDEDDARRTTHLTEMLPLLDVLASAYALRALDELNAFDQPTAAERASGVAGAACADAGGRRPRPLAATAPPDADADACASLPAADDLWRELIAQSPSHVAELTLLAHVGAALPRRSCAAKDDAAGDPAGRRAAAWWSISSKARRRGRMSISHDGRLRERGDRRVGRSRAACGCSKSTRPTSDVLQPLGLHLPLSRCECTIAGTQEQLSAFDPVDYPGLHALTLDSGAHAQAPRTIR